MKVLADLVVMRKSAGDTQRDIAHRMHTSQTFISDMERGKTDPRLSTLQRYARAAGARLSITIEESSGDAGPTGLEAGL